mmetsp:Transcript_23897/g.80714  ORF Transcript_23897/g.80714 Transcript_23897/m.80714 type:complete len:357 (+) Transcript_23897:125-1195(+)
MPSLSIGSSKSLLSPAVSDRTTGMPPSCSDTVTTSRVVPSIGETIAASRRASRLRSEDLPAFGGPRIATRTPSRTASPRPPSSSSDSISRRISCISPTADESAASVTSSASSPKSISASVCARARTIRPRHASSNRLCPPPIAASACRRCASVCALIRSPSASTSVKSIRPLACACRVNSPGSASRWYERRPSASSVALTTAGEPCVCSSTVSSPVKERGPGSQSTSAWSISSPSPVSPPPPSPPSPPATSLPGCLRLRSTARRGGGRPSSPPPPGHIRCKTSLACGPETRMTETPARTPAPEESANMVSASSADGCSPSNAKPAADGLAEQTTPRAAVSGPRRCAERRSGPVARP